MSLDIYVSQSLPMLTTRSSTILLICIFALVGSAGGVVSILPQSRRHTEVNVV